MTDRIGKCGFFTPQNRIRNVMPVLEGIKKQLDPNNIMNPGKLGFEGA